MTCSVNGIIRNCKKKMFSLGIFDMKYSLSMLLVSLLMPNGVSFAFCDENFFSLISDCTEAPEGNTG